MNYAAGNTVFTIGELFRNIESGIGYFMFSIKYGKNEADRDKQIEKLSDTDKLTEKQVMRKTAKNR